MNLTIGWLVSVLATAQATTLAPGGKLDVSLGRLKAGQTYRVEADLGGLIGGNDRVRVSLKTSKSTAIFKTIHAGDPDFTTLVRFPIDQDGTLAIESNPTSGPTAIRTSWRGLDLDPADRLPDRGRAERHLARGQLR